MTFSHPGELFTRLGDSVAKSFRAVDYEESAPPAIAAAALADARLGEKLDATSVLAWASTSRLPPHSVLAVLDAAGAQLSTNEA